MVLRCIKCKKVLKGRQKKFCRKQCNRNYYGMLIYNKRYKKRDDNARDNCMECKKKVHWRGIYFCTDKCRLKFNSRKDYYKNREFWIIRNKSRRFFKPIKCYLCGKDNKLELHHYTIPYEFDKVMGICNSCHNLVHKKGLQIRINTREINKTYQEVEDEI